MKINLKQEYKEADFNNIETLKQIVINKFQENNLPLSKIIKSRLGDGLYVYGPYCSEQSRNYRKLVKKLSDNEYLYERGKKFYKCNFISTENFNDFELYLLMVLTENLNRKNK